MAKLSVVVPVFNNEVYVKTCLDSLLAQTYKDLEIICINDGSTDNSLQVLEEYASRDNRIKVVDKANEGYGVAINTGLDMCTGEYFTILESDDFADLDYYETLMSYAVRFNLDVAKSNFYLYWSKKIKKDFPLYLFADFECDKLIDTQKRKDQHCFYVQPAIWSAIYKTSFLKENELRLLPTPGAAYQDTAFNFKVWACARRVMMVYKPFVHYRQDNEASSINNRSKAYSICTEYEEIDRWLSEDRPDLRHNLAPVMWKMMCDAYEWNTTRISDNLRKDFVRRFAHDLGIAYKKHEIDEKLFAPGQKSRLDAMLKNNDDYIKLVIDGVDYANTIDKISRKARTLSQFTALHGPVGTLRLVRDKMVHRSGENIVDLFDIEMSTRKPPKFITTPIEPKISVILTVYNTSDCLVECMDSIFAQSFTDFELIVINDGSTDNSEAIIQSYVEKDSRIRLINQKNKGVSVARNIGMREAKADYFCILDSDDIFYPDMLLNLYKTAVENDCDLVVGPSDKLDSTTYRLTPMSWSLRVDWLANFSTVFSAKDVSERLFQAIMGWPWDRLYKKSFVESCHIEFPEIKNSEDAVFVYAVLCKAQRISIVREPIVKHRLNRKSSLSNSRSNNPEEFYKAIHMLKEYLVQEGLYQDFERSFINWAADYTLWNIESLPEGKTKKQLVNKLFARAYADAELFEHKSEYFSLVNSIKKRLRRLRWGI